MGWFNEIWKKIFFLIIIISLILTLSPTFANDNLTLGSDNANTINNDFKTLENELSNTPDGSQFNLTHNYVYNNQTDSNCIRIINRNITINGNGYTIDGGNQKDIFYIKSSDVYFNNLLLTNANADVGSALTAEYSKVFSNNLSIINSVGDRGVLILSNSYYEGNNDKFINLYSGSEGIIILEASTMISDNSLFSSSYNLNKGFVYAPQSNAQFTNCSFENITSMYSSAIYGGKLIIVRNSTFTNLYANLTAGALSVKGGSLVVDNCNFYNVSSENNGGAIFTDLYGNASNRLLINNAKFTECESGFGGVVLALDGFVEITNSTFANNSAYYDGGAIYTSYVTLNIFNTEFINNSALKEGLGGGLFFDMGTLTVSDSKFINNNAFIGEGIYSNDGNINIKKSTFINNDIYTDFDTGCSMADNSFENSKTIMNNTEYSYLTVSKADKLNLTVASNSSNIPSRYDLRDLGWVSPVKSQGEQNVCWSFGLTAALESALLKEINKLYDFSENNIKSTVLKYSKYGFTDLNEEAYSHSAIGYLLSWMGVLPNDYDVYDELGKISQLINTEEAFHIQNVIYLRNTTSRDALKKAIMDYGAIEIGYYVNSNFYNAKTYANYNPNFHTINHMVAVVGWDDNYSKDNFLITPPGDGAWIIKNSWGTGFGDKGYLYISYYDKGFFSDGNPAIAIVLNDTNRFNKNYQTDFGGASSFLGKYKYYSNTFTASDDEIITAIGTYFIDAGLNYNFSIYVNNELKLTQNWVSEYYGFKTINLNKNIIINEGDTFKVVFNSPSTPVQEDSRSHIMPNTSFVSINGEDWIDTATLNNTVSLKVYTLNLDENINLTCNNYSAYLTNAGNLTGEVSTTEGDSIAGRSVYINLTRKTTGASKVYEVVTDSNGVFNLPINLGTDFYTFTVDFKSNNASKGTVASSEGNIIIVDEKTDKISTILATANYEEEYGAKEPFVGVLFDFDSNVLQGQHVKLNLTRLSSGASKIYDVVCDYEGVFSLDINLAPGQYTVLCTFDGNDVYEASCEENTLTVY